MISEKMEIFSIRFHIHKSRWSVGMILTWSETEMDVMGIDIQLDKYLNKRNKILARNAYWIKL